MGESQGELRLDGGAKRRRGSSRRIPLLVTWVPDVQQIIGKLADLECEVAPAESPDELLEVAGQTQPDIVVLAGNGLDKITSLVAQLATRAPDAAIVVLFSRPSEAELLALVHAGAVGYLPVTIPPERLCAAVEAVLAGEPAVPRSMTRALVRQLGSAGCIVLPTDGGEALELSAREWEVLCLLKQGCSTSEIAERLFVASATVRSHVAAVERKLGAPDRDAALEKIFAS